MYIIGVLTVARILILIFLILQLNVIVHFNFKSLHVAFAGYVHVE